MSIFVTLECMLYNRILIMDGLLAFTFRDQIGILDMAMENHDIIETTLQEIQVEGLAMEDHQRDELKYIIARFEKNSMLESHIIFIWLKDSE